MPCLKNMAFLLKESMNIIIPMAGAGSRFIESGYKSPKPLIAIKNKPMIQVALNSLNINGNIIYLTLKHHYDTYNLKEILNSITPGCDVLTVDKLTDGAACTVLLAEQLIDNDNPLIIANCDQFIEWDSNGFNDLISNANVDAAILTFESNNPKCSYVKSNDEYNVIEVAEKRIISTKATVGIYYWKKGSDYVKYAKQMISKNIRTNNEFYVAPVYNEAIADNKNIKIYDVNKMWVLGTPEDLHYFLKNYEGKI